MKTVTGLLVGVLLTCGIASAQSQTLAILMPGSGGAVPGDFLMRNKARIEAAGIQTEVTTSPSEAAAISQRESAKGRKVVIVGMSMGVQHVASALAAGAKVRGAVLVSGMYNEARANLGSPALLPTTLMIHHANDQCPSTSPAIARDFAQWARGKATLRWINTKGVGEGRFCGPRQAHGFFVQDGPAVSAMVGFIRSR